MADTGQGISVGDAVLTFLGDTTNLDAAYDRVGAQAAAKLQPAQDAISDIGDAWQFAGHTAATAGDEAEIAGTKIADAGEKAAGGMRHAAEATRTVEEAIGVRLPRGVNSFLAELPGIASAVDIAFSASVVFFLIEAVVQASEKLTNFISTTFIFTQAMKDSDAAIAKSNVTLLAHAESVKKSEEEMSKWGKTAAGIAQDTVAKLTDELKQNDEQFRDALDNIYGWNNSVGVSKDVADKAKASLTELASAHKDLSAQLEIAKHAQDELSSGEQNAAGKELIEIRQKSGEALIGLQTQQALRQLLVVKQSVAQEAQVQRDADTALYQLKLSGLQQQLNLTQTEGQEGVAEAARILGEIESLNTEHKTKILANYVSMMERLKQITAQPIPLITAPVSNTVELSGLAKEFADAQQQAENLGITLQSTLVKASKDAGDAYLRLIADYKSGVVTQKDVIEGDKKWIQSQIDAAKALNLTKLQVRELTTELQKLNSGTDNSAVKIKHLSDLFGKFEKDAGGTQEVITTLTTIGKTAFNQFGASVEKAFADAVLGQGNFAVAMEKALASALASIAAQAAVQAIYYTAEGFAALASYNGVSASNYFTAAAEMAAVAVVAGVAGHEIAGAASGGSNSGGSSSTSNKPVSAASDSGNVGNVATNPTQTTNVQRLGDGALISKRTLAVIGDSLSGGNAREAVMPLDHPESLAAIAGALAPHIAAHLGAMGGGTVHVHMPKGSFVGTAQDLARNINKGVKSGKVTLHSSNTFRVTKRSI
jgi:hypothetical protein